MSNEHFLNLGLTSQISSPVSINEDGSEVTELEMKESRKFQTAWLSPYPWWVQFKKTYTYTHGTQNKETPDQLTKIRINGDIYVNFDFLSALHIFITQRQPNDAMSKVCLKWAKWF